ncbi:MAG: pseudaminic acid synthase [Epsilonproteobacteria bacterium]|nr:pseudaminic acid synthase [Campylobacterota bacterium]NPA56876.1 pseudaminic acid synthase [Campylobacterota bacterium]
MRIGSHSTEERVFIIAELSANHGGSLELALETVHAAKEAGADGVKLQTYTPEWLTIDSDREEFIVGRGSLWEGVKLYDLYREAMTPLQWHGELFETIRSLGMVPLSSPFSREAVDFLEQFDLPAYKIASFEIRDYDLVAYAASKGRAMIISTGVAQFEDLKRVTEICREAGVEMALLRCSSAYPAPPSHLNLKTIPYLRELFGVEVGLSDHTLGVAAPIGAVALGARIIEKHFILDRGLESPDREFSLTPREFREMVQGVREMEEMVGGIELEPQRGREFARSLYVVADIGKGERLTRENIRSIRPGYGLHPKYLPQVLGKRACRPLKRGEPLRWEDITD